MTNEDWGKAVTRRVAAEIKRRRGKNTVQWVADRTAELGYPVSRSRISDLEAGKRGGLIGVAELMIIAEALQVSPVELLFGAQLVTGDVEHLPGRMVTAWGALLWFTGEWPSDGDRGRRLELIRELETIPKRRRDIETELAKSRRELDEARRELAENLPFHTERDGDLSETGALQKDIHHGRVKNAERMVEFYRANLDTLHHRERDIVEELRAAGYVVELPLWNAEGKP